MNSHDHQLLTSRENHNLDVLNSRTDTCRNVGSVTSKDSNVVHNYISTHHIFEKVKHF